jgi:zinc/manganese transport system substrate-binding protein
MFITIGRRQFLISAGLTALCHHAVQADEKIRVIASFSILGDLVANVGRDRIVLTTLVGPDGDAHAYQPTPADSKALAHARLIIVNGLGFEGWSERLIEASGATGLVVTASAGLTAKGADQAPDDLDPHAWQSIANSKIYVRNIRDGLIAADPAGKSAYEANTSAYLIKLEALEIFVRTMIAGIPAARRRIITSHDAFGYFGAAYGLAFIAPQSVSTETEISAKGVAAIIRQVRVEKIPAVFIENISDPRMMQRIADETGAKIGGTLYSDALSDDKGPAATYIDMMTHNVTELAKVLSQ